jgi:glutaredoxin
MKVPFLRPLFLLIFIIVSVGITSVSFGVVADNANNASANNASERIDIIVYYGAGCPHCARMDALLDELKSEYNLNIVKKEVYLDAKNRQEMFDLYMRFGKDPNEGGVPTLLLENRI